MTKNLRKSIAVVIVLLLVSALALFGMGVRIADGEGKGEVAFSTERQTGTYKAPATATGIATLHYDPDNSKVVTSVEFSSASEDCIVTVPAEVEKINDDVFKDAANIVAVTFAIDSKLNYIGANAFAGTSIESIVLPNSLKTIGDAAFKDCVKLTSVTLPSSGAAIGDEAFSGCNLINNVTLGANTTLGANSFASDVILIADNASTYNKLKTNTAYSDRLTYVVTVNYYYSGALMETEKKLFGKGYDFELNNGIWANTATKFGTVITKTLSDKWFSDEGLSDEVTVSDSEDTGSDIDTLINASVGELNLYAGKEFCVVYDKHVAEIEFKANVSYSEADLGMMFFFYDWPTFGEVSLYAYINEHGEKVDELPETAHNVGTYIYKSDKDMGEDVAYILKIKYAEISWEGLDYSDWKIVSDSSMQNFVAENVLYLYEMSNGGLYPSVKRITSETITSAQQNMGISVNRYETRRVTYSVVRARGESVTINLDTHDLFTVESISDNIHTEIGTYTTVATLKANEGYIFDENSFPAPERGITIEIESDCKTAKVTKIWYIVEIDNWFVFNGTTSEYNIENRTFEDIENSVEIPRLMFGDIENAAYGTSADPVTLTLFLKTASDANYRPVAVFKRNTFRQYLNTVMPVGDYRLELSTGEIKIDDNTKYDPITSEITFKVEPKTIDLEVIESIDAALMKKSFNYDWIDGTAPLYDVSTEAAINRVLAEVEAVPDRTGTVWNQPAYNDLYSELRLVFNLARQQSDLYFDAEHMPIKTNTPGAYKIYYKLAAENYLDSIESRDNVARTDSFFSVTVIRTIKAPTLGVVSYTGSAQKADIGDSEFYTTKPYDGFTEAGTHSVTLVLREKDYYCWEGKSLGNAEIEVPFVINPAANNWLESPDVVRWVEGSFNEDENKFIGAVAFGNISYVITDTEENVIYDLSQGIDERASMKAGTYILRASVAGNDNYNGLSEAFIIRILEKEGMPWWGTLCITLGALLVAAIIILILWKKGVFQILTGKIVLAIRTRASVDATIAAVRAAKMMEEGRRSVEEAKRREAEEEKKQNK